MEHRGSVHGPPRHSTVTFTAFHGLPPTLHGLPRIFHGRSRTLHGLPRNAAASSGLPLRSMALAIAIHTVVSTAGSTAISTAIFTAAPTAYHGKPRRPAARSRQNPRTHSQIRPRKTRGLVHGTVRVYPRIGPRNHPPQDPRTRPRAPTARLRSTAADGRGCSWKLLRLDVGGNLIIIAADVGCFTLFLFIPKPRI